MRTNPRRARGILVALATLAGVLAATTGTAGADPGGIVISELNYHAGSDLDTDDYLLFRALPDNAVEQTAVTPRALRERPLVAPYRDEAAS